MPRTSRRNLREDKKVVYESKNKYSTLRPKNQEQADFARAIRRCTVNIAFGLAGSGKSHISCGVGAELLNSGEVDKVVIIRPNLECGISLGLLPGEISDKLNPYMVPLLTELGYFLPVKEYLAQGKVVIQPLAYSRGMTFKNSVVIVDEVQNIDETSLKMILSRIGEGSKYILIGDYEQSDLKPGPAQKTLYRLDRLIELSEHNPDISFTHLKESVRHPLISTLMKVFA